MEKANKLVRKAVPGQHVLFGFPEEKEPFAWEDTVMRWKGGGGTPEAPVFLSFGAPEGDQMVRPPGDSLEDPPCLTLTGVGLETEDGRPNPKGPAFAVLREGGVAHLRVTGPVVHRAGENGGVFKVAEDAQLFDLGFRQLHASRAAG